MRTATREALIRARHCPCDATRGESCPVDDGAQDIEDEYWERDTTTAERQEFDRAMARWWLDNRAAPTA